MSADSRSSTPPSPAEGRPILGVRYSLRKLLDELKLERTSGSYAMEKLDQNEIGKLFKTPVRRAKSQK